MVLYVFSCVFCQTQLGTRSVFDFRKSFSDSMVGLDILWKRKKPQKKDTWIRTLSLI